MTPSPRTAETPPVLMVGPYPPVIGGTAAMLARLVPALAEAGVKCRVLNTQVGDRQGGILERIKRLAFFKLLAMRAALAPEKTVHCHAVNFANLVGNGIVLLTCRLFGKHTVLTLHAGDLLAKLSSGRSQYLGRFILKLANVVTTVTPELRDKCLELDVPQAVFISNELRYIPHGGDGKELPPEVAQFIANHSPVVTLVGAMNPPYGIDILLRSVAVARHDLPLLGALVIAFKSNNTAYTTGIQSLLGELDLADQVLIPAPFPNVAEALRRSDIFVRPTLSDGDSIAVREALTLKLPVVASDTGFRPKGVVVFPVGDHEKLAERIKDIQAGKIVTPPLDESSEQETIDQFVTAYHTAANR